MSSRPSTFIVPPINKDTQYKRLLCSIVEQVDSLNGNVANNIQNIEDLNARVAYESVSLPALIERQAIRNSDFISLADDTLEGMNKSLLDYSGQLTTQSSIIDANIALLDSLASEVSINERGVLDAKNAWFTTWTIQQDHNVRLARLVYLVNKMEASDEAPDINDDWWVFW